VCPKVSSDLSGNSNSTRKPDFVAAANEEEDHILKENAITIEVLKDGLGVARGYSILCARKAYEPRLVGPSTAPDEFG